MIRNISDLVTALQSRGVDVRASSKGSIQAVARIKVGAEEHKMMVMVADNPCRLKIGCPGFKIRKERMDEVVEFVNLANLSMGCGHYVLVDSPLGVMLDATLPLDLVSITPTHLVTFMERVMQSWLEREPFLLPVLNGKTPAEEQIKKMLACYRRSE